MSDLEHIFQQNNTDTSLSINFMQKFIVYNTIPNCDQYSVTVPKSVTQRPNGMSSGEGYYSHVYTANYSILFHP